MLSILSFFLLAIAQAPSVNFEPQIIDDNVAIGYGIAIGDVDGDGKPDILIADKKQFVWYRNGDWKKFVMVENLTERDNVCIAAMDITGDGKVEVAVGAQWNPGETGNTQESGSVHYLIAPDDRTQPWKAVQLPHEPTIHRMRWAQAADGKYHLIVAPLHGRNNKGGEGEGVKMIAYEFPGSPAGTWPTKVLDQNMHLSHNLDIVQSGSQTDVYFAGKEGVRIVKSFSGKNASGKAESLPGMTSPAGEVRVGNNMIATIEPMHGTAVVAYLGDARTRVVLDDQLKEGHALAVADFNGTGRQQVVAGWRSPDANGNVGIKLYLPPTANGSQWSWQWVDENGMACEDLQVADLNGDGKPDIIAAGRATNNLKIYWTK